MLGYCAWRLVLLIAAVSLGQWGATIAASGWTLLRVLAATAIGTLWALPAGLAIGLSPRLSRIFQPVVQVGDSFPAPLLFPMVIAALEVARVPLEWGRLVRMPLGSQRCIVVHVIAGAVAVPAHP